jgi:ankyrin repeat protein
MLWDSIRRNSEHNVRVILSANFPVNAPLNPLGMTALHFACSTSTKEVIMAILSYNPDINARDFVRSYVVNVDYS